MAQQKIADFFAQIGIKVDERSIKKLDKSIDSISRGLHNMEVNAKKASKNLSQSIVGEKDLSKSITSGNKALVKRAQVLKSISRINEKSERIARRAQARAAFSGLTPDRMASRWNKATSGSGSAKAWNRNFREAVGSLTSRSSGMTAKAYKAQQGMYDQLFGATNDSPRQKMMAQVQKEYMRNMERLSRQQEIAAKRKENAARVSANLAKREQQMAERTAAIREAGARRAAAIIQAAEIRAAAMANRASGRGSGGSRGGRGMFSGATLGGAVGGASSHLAGFLPGFGGAYALMNFNKTGQEIVAAENAIKALAPTGDEAAKILTFLQGMGREMGGSYSDMTRQFASIYASTRQNIGADQTQNIFRGIMKYGSVLGMDDEAMKGTLRAVSQMFSKDRIMAEEARSQLAERMPAAMQMLADTVAGGSTKKLDKMMTAGELDPKVVMPMFANIAEQAAEANDAYAKSLMTSRTAQRRMNYEFEMFVKLFNTSGGDKGFAQIFNSISRFMKDNPNLATGMANGLTKLATALDWTMDGLTNVIELFDDLGDNLGIGGTNLALFTAGVMLLSTHFGRLAAMAYGFFLIIEDIAVGMKGGDSYTKDFLEFLNDNKWAAAAVGAAAFAVSLGAIAAAIGRIGGAMGGIGGKGAGGILSKTVGVVKSHPYLTAAVAAGTGYAVAYNDFMTSSDPNIVNERNQIDLRLKNLQRGPGNGFLTDMTNQFPLPGINQPSTHIENIEINVQGVSDPEATADMVVDKFKRLINSKNFPVNE